MRPTAYGAGRRALPVKQRPVVGAFHQVSCKHLPAYLDEFEFRFNYRENPYIFRDAMKELLTAENVEYKELVA